MTSLFGRMAAGQERRSGEGKGKAGGAVSSQTAGCEPRAEETDRTRAGCQEPEGIALMSAVEKTKPSVSTGGNKFSRQMPAERGQNEESNYGY